MEVGQTLRVCLRVDGEHTTILQDGYGIARGRHDLRGDLLEELQQSEDGTYQFPHEYGSRLYKATLTDQLAQRFGEQLQAAVGKTLRLILDITDQRLHALNWESLWRQENGAFKPFACRKNFGLSRMCIVGTVDAEVLERTRLKLLVAVANPRAHVGPEFQAIDQEPIIQAVHRMAAPEIHLEALPQPVTARALRARLADGDVDLLHLVAHGVGRDTIGLQLDDELPLEAAELADVIGTLSLPLVTLVACGSGASRAMGDRVSSFAETLLQHTDVGAVIAMCRLIGQQEAVSFTDGLYRKLSVDHDRSVLFDVAANRGRQTILSLSQTGKSSWQWATPVLFYRDAPPRCLVQPSGVPTSTRRDPGGFPDEYHQRQGAELSGVLRAGDFNALWGSVDPRWTGVDVAEPTPARDALHQGQVDEPMPKVAALVEQHPDDPEVLARLSLRLEQRGELFAALEVCDKLVALDPDGPAGWVRRAQVRATVARTADQDGDEAHQLWRQALTDAEGGVRRGPRDAAAYLEYARVLTSLGRLEEADEAYERAGDLDPSSISAQVEYGRLLLERQEPAAALQVFDRALDLDETCVAAHSGKGDALLELGGDYRALLSFGRALQRDPDHRGARRGRMVAAINRAQRARRLHRLAEAQDLCDRAVEDGERAVQLDLEQPWAYAHLARALRVDHAYDQAVQRLGQARQLAADDAPLLATLLAEEGDTLRQWGSFMRQESIMHRALARFDEAIGRSLDPREVAWIHAAKGSALLRMGELDRAESAFRDSIKSDDGHGWGHVGLGRTLLLLSRMQEAQAVFEELGDRAAGRRRLEAWSRLGAMVSAARENESHRLALEGLPEFPKATDCLDRAVIFEQLGQRRLAEHHHVLALGLEPDRVETRLAVGWSYLLGPPLTQSRQRRYRYEDAAMHAGRALELANGQRSRPHCLHLLGWALFLLGDLPRAVSNLRQANHEHPRDVCIRVRLQQAVVAMQDPARPTTPVGDFACGGE